MLNGERPRFDQRDEEIKSERVALWNARTGPRVGDFVIMPDGTTRRFTYAWDDDIQTTSKTYPGDASFYFAGACCSFSGSLNPGLPKKHLVDTGDVREGAVWFFHHDQARAHNGVRTTIPCRVYRYEPPHDQVT
jgi:hypothetical protein